MVPRVILGVSLDVLTPRLAVGGYELTRLEPPGGNGNTLSNEIGVRQYKQEPCEGVINRVTP